MTAAVGATPAPSVLKLAPEQRLKIHEVFYSLQGESTAIGRPCVLIRLTGCQMRCRWCDTTYSFYEGGWRSLEDLLAEVEEIGCPLVELTGGEPLLQPGALPLMRQLCDRGYEVLLETGGGVDIGAVDPRVRRIMDVKCPGSGEAENNHWPNLDLLTPLDELKFVLADEADYVWARELIRRMEADGRLASLGAVHLSPVHGELEAGDLAAWILRDGLPARLQLQLHKLLWGAEQRGV